MSHKQWINSFGYIVHSINTISTRHRNRGRRSAASRMGHSDPGRSSAASRMGHSDPGRSSAASRMGHSDPGRRSAASRVGRVKAVEADKGRLMG